MGVQIPPPEPLKAKYSRRSIRQLFCNRVCKGNFGWEHTCIICGTIFINNGPVGKYCTKRCKEKSRTSVRGKEETCHFCNGSFKVRADNNSGKFCSQKCAGYYSRLFEGKNNYRVKAFVFYGLRCNRCSITDERTLIVHHKDHNPLNNEILNLEVLCANCHNTHHWAESVNQQTQIEAVKHMEGAYAVKEWKEKYR